MKVYTVVASDSNNTMDESVDVFESETDATIWRYGIMIYDLVNRQMEKGAVDICDSISCRMANNGDSFRAALADEYEEIMGRHVWIYEKEIR